jgi:hypothetical protein
MKAREVPVWVGRSAGGQGGTGQVMSPDHPLYAPAIARTAALAGKAKDAFAARMDRLLAAKTPEEREKIEKQMRGADARDAQAQLERRMAEAERTDRIAQSRAAMSAMRKR